VSPTFQALRNRNYRYFLAGAVVSNIGTWMQRIAQDWLVLQLSGGSGTALGITTALQFLPALLFGPWGGLLADRYPKRRLLLISQAGMGLLALVLGLLVAFDNVTLGWVYALAFCLGLLAAVDSPTRQSFVVDMVGKEDLPNAVGLNSTAFHGARIVGPAIAGLLITAFGTAPVFLLNAVSFLAVIAGLLAIDPKKLRPSPKAPRAKGQIRDGVRYLRTRRDLMLVMLVVGVVATLGLNFSVTMALMATQVFGKGAQGYGLLATALGVGSVAGALGAARRQHPTLGLVAWSAVAFGVLETVAALMPSYLTFALALVPAGFAVLTVMTASNATIQLGVASEYRGRVMAIYLTIFLGGTPIGAPLIGWMSEVYGPRSALVLGGVSSLAVGVVALLLLRRVARQRSVSAARVAASEVVTEVLAESMSLEEAAAYPGAAPVAQRQRQSP
jgi:MFS family permease